MTSTEDRIRYIQEEIARRAAQPEEGPEETLDVLVFTLAEEQYAFPLAAMREVSRIGPITPLPGLPPTVLGATGLRGEVLPVVDLRRFLGLEEQPLTSESRLLVVRHEALSVALIADRVADIATLSDSAFLPPPAKAAEEKTAFLEGIAHEGQTAIRLLDPARLLEAIRHAQ